MLNHGHGHVFPRADGIRARCGGPPICDECDKDYFHKNGGGIGPLAALIESAKPISLKPGLKDDEGVRTVLRDMLEDKEVEYDGAIVLYYTSDGQPKIQVTCLSNADKAYLLFYLQENLMDIIRRSSG